jgi:hypothetical protein
MIKYYPLLERATEEEVKKIVIKKALEDFCGNLLKTISKSFFSIDAPVEKTKTSFKSYKVTFQTNDISTENLEKIKNVLEKQFEWGDPEGTQKIQFDKTRIKRYYISILYDETEGNLNMNFIHGYDGGGHSLGKKSIPTVSLPDNLDTKLFSRFFSSYARMMRESGNEAE